MPFSYHLRRQPGILIAIGDGIHEGTVAPLNSADYFALKGNRRPRTLSAWMEREAIRAHDSEAAETAWDRCERWLGLWPLEQTTPPAPAPSTPVDNKISAGPVGKEG